MTTDIDVAAWMLDELNRKNHLYQEHAAWEIKKLFGAPFVYDNGNGNPAISKAVLKEFNKVTPDLIWSRSERFWRARMKSDKPGRTQD